MTDHDKTFRAITIVKAFGHEIVAFKEFIARAKKTPPGDFDWRTTNFFDLAVGFFIALGVNPLQASYIATVCKNDLGIWLT